MRESNTGHKNITYDTARCKSLADALEIRDAWAKERDQLGARGNTARNGRAGAIRIERREVVIFFD